MIYAIKKGNRFYMGGAKGWRGSEVQFSFGPIHKAKFYVSDAHARQSLSALDFPDCVVVEVEITTKEG